MTVALAVRGVGLWSGSVVTLLRLARWLMGGRVIDKAFVDGLLDAFAAKPGNAAAAAAQCKCDHRTAKRAWALGWPKYGIPPLSETIAAQQVAARALANREETAALEGNRDAHKQLKIEASMHAAKDREREGQIVRATRDSALALQAITMNLAKRGHILTQNITDAELQELTISGRLKALKTIAEFAEKAANTAEKAINLHRLIMGEPTSFIAVEHTHEHAHVHVSNDEMVAVIARAQGAVERAQEAGILEAVVVDPDDS